jgi:hypothetical protein
MRKISVNFINNYFFFSRFFFLSKKIILIVLGISTEISNKFSILKIKNKKQRKKTKKKIHTEKKLYSPNLLKYFFFN